MAIIIDKGWFIDVQEHFPTRKYKGKSILTMHKKPVPHRDLVTGEEFIIHEHCPVCSKEARYYGDKDELICWSNHIKMDRTRFFRQRKNFV